MLGLLAASTFQEMGIDALGDSLDDTLKRWQFKEENDRQGITTHDKVQASLGEEIKPEGHVPFGTKAGG